MPLTKNDAMKTDGMKTDGMKTDGIDHELIYDWNSTEKLAPLSGRRRVQFLDETLRDGIQSPSVVDPTIEDKLALVELANELGIDTMDIGLPGAGKRAVEDVTTIAEHIRDGKLRVKASCAARTHQHDVQAVVDISQKVGIEIEILCFIGSSPIRQYAEDWDLARMMKLSADAIDLGRRYNLPVAYVTEDTTRSRPEVLTKLFTNAVEHGASRLIVCDTVGHATPDGIKT
jgi:2-isopropylmalate synthase